MNIPNRSLQGYPCIKAKISLRLDTVSRQIESAPCFALWFPANWCFQHTTIVRVSTLTCFIKTLHLPKVFWRRRSRAEKTKSASGRQAEPAHCFALRFPANWYFQHTTIVRVSTLTRFIKTLHLPKIFLAEKESSRKNKVCQWQTLPASVPRRFVRAFGDEQIGFEDKKRQLRNSELSFGRRRRDSLRYPSPKNSPPDCFSIKIKIFMAAQSTPSSPIKIKKTTLFSQDRFLAEKEGLEPSRQF